MENSELARLKLDELKSRTKIDLYELDFEAEDYVVLDTNTLDKVREICKENDFKCPIYRRNGQIRFKVNEDTFFESLRYLASEHSIVFDLKNTGVIQS